MWSVHVVVFVLRWEKVAAPKCARVGTSWKSDFPSYYNSTIIQELSHLKSISNVWYSSLVIPSVSWMIMVYLSLRLPSSCSSRLTSFCFMSCLHVKTVHSRSHSFISYYSSEWPPTVKKASSCLHVRMDVQLLSASVPGAVRDLRASLDRETGRRNDEGERRHGNNRECPGWT